MPFHKEMEDFIKESKKKIAALPKTKDTRTAEVKARDKAFDNEAAEWKRQREEAQKQQLERFIKNQGTSSPRGGSY